MRQLSPRARRYARIAAVIVAFVATSAATVTAASAATSGASLHRQHCEVVQDVTEQTIRWESMGNGGLGMVVGDFATYYDNIYDAADNVIGHAVGLVAAVSNRSSDGHLIADYTEGIQLASGSLRTHGYVDRNVLLSGNWVRIPAFGLSGTYLNKAGYREVQVIIPSTPPTSISDVRIRVKMVMCGD